MGDRVDERVMLLVPANLADQKDGVEDHAGDDCRQQQNAQNQEEAMVPVEQHPTDIKEDGDNNDADAERDKKRDRLSPSGNHHALRVPRRTHYRAAMYY